MSLEKERLVRGRALIARLDLEPAFDFLFTTIIKIFFLYMFLKYFFAMHLKIVFL